MSGCPYCTPRMTDPVCGEDSPPYVCTRTPEHDGLHVACGTAHNIAAWKDPR